MVKYAPSLVNPVMQKNRFTQKIIFKKLHFGSRGIYFLNEGQMEIKQIFMTRRIMRKIRKRRKKRKSKQKPLKQKKNIWFFLFPNFILSKKSKNSRMGKGKGSIKRWVIRIKPGSIFLEFKNISNWKLIYIVSKLAQLIRMKLKIFSKNTKTTHSCGKYQICRIKRDYKYYM